jgi:hypothetical protein
MLVELTAEEMSDTAKVSCQSAAFNTPVHSDFYKEFVYGLFLWYGDFGNLPYSTHVISTTVMNFSFPMGEDSMR